MTHLQQIPITRKNKIKDTAKKEKGGGGGDGEEEDSHICCNSRFILVLIKSDIKVAEEA